MFSGKAVALAAAAFLFAPHATRADGLTGFVAPVVGYSQQLSDIESGGRCMLRFDFTRLAQWVSLDARLGFGNGVTDYGGVIKFFHHWYLGDRASSATGFSLGAGLGAMAGKGDSPIVLAGGIGSVASRSFVDLIVHPFGRFLYDTGDGYGFFVDLGFDMVPLRVYKSGSPSREGSFRNRVFIAVGFPIGA